MHGGTVTARSQGPGTGSEFVISLPASEAKRAKAPAGLELPPRELVSQAGKRVLVVDDNVDTAQGLARLLRLRGHAVEVAFDGATALEMAGRATPQAVLLDLGLPGLDGFQVCERLRRDGCANVLIVAVSGYGQEEDRRRSREAGFDHHLVKPVAIEELARLLAGS